MINALPVLNVQPQMHHQSNAQEQELSNTLLQVQLNAMNVQLVTNVLQFQQHRQLAQLATIL